MRVQGKSVDSAGSHDSNITSTSQAYAVVGEVNVGSIVGVALV
jgi:hypothetical protein